MKIAIVPAKTEDIDTLVRWGDTLFVDEKFRGLGIGKKLIDEMMKRLKKIEGVTTFALEVKEDNSARKFYTKLGFYEGFRFVWMQTKI